MTRTDRSPRKRLDPTRRQEIILAAATEQFAAQPYEQVSMAAVAEQAEASEALLYRYFGSKANLYVAVIRAAMDALASRQQAALDQLDPQASPRERVRASLGPYLDYIAASADGWASAILLPGNDPTEAVNARAEIRAGYVDALREITGHRPGRDYGLYGYFGFLDAACLVWVQRRCPVADRPALIEAALTALFGDEQGVSPDPVRRGKFGRR